MSGKGSPTACAQCRQTVGSALPVFLTPMVDSCGYQIESPPLLEKYLCGRRLPSDLNMTTVAYRAACGGLKIGDQQELMRGGIQRQADHVGEQSVGTGVIGLQLPIPHKGRIEIGSVAVLC